VEKTEGGPSDRAKSQKQQSTRKGVGAGGAKGMVPQWGQINPLREGESLCKIGI